jgi:GT2 family glycosyltransferase
MSQLFIHAKYKKISKKASLRKEIPFKEVSIPKVETKKPHLAIIVPYRDRKENLSKFLPYMETFLGKAGIKYSVIIAEQDEKESFNRGMMKNIGFDLSKNKNYDYFAFHDVDLIPLEVDYSLITQPTHLVGKIGERCHIGLNISSCGGVIMFKKEDFITINGFSNGYWGWGVEDDDLSWRMSVAGVHRVHRAGVYEELSHSKAINQEEYSNNCKRLGTFDGKNYLKDGLNSLHYKIIEEQDIGFNATKYTISIKNYTKSFFKM